MWGEKNSSFRSNLLEGAVNVYGCMCVTIEKGNAGIGSRTEYSDWHEYVHRFIPTNESYMGCKRIALGRTGEVCCMYRAKKRKEANNAWIVVLCCDYQNWNRCRCISFFGLLFVGHILHMHKCRLASKQAGKQVQMRPNRRSSPSTWAWTSSLSSESIHSTDNTELVSHVRESVCVCESECVNGFRMCVELCVRACEAADRKHNTADWALKMQDKITIGSVL